MWRFSRVRPGARRRGPPKAERRRWRRASGAAGASLISYTAEFGNGSDPAKIRAFRRPLLGKPTVLHTCNLNTLTCANDRWNLALGMYRA